MQANFTYQDQIDNWQMFSLFQNYIGYVYGAMATFLMLPMPGGLGTYYTNFHQEFQGKTNFPFPQWNFPAYCMDYIQKNVYHELETWSYFTEVFTIMTNDPQINISVIDIAPILAPVPDYIGSRRYTHV